MMYLAEKLQFFFSGADWECLEVLQYTESIDTLGAGMDEMWAGLEVFAQRRPEVVALKLLS